jgi:hypothetical protein
MRARLDARQPRRLIALFLALTLIPSALLVALGWSLFEQDRVNAQRELQQRREQTADLAVTTLAQIVGTAEQSLRDPAAHASLVGPTGRSFSSGAAINSTCCRTDESHSSPRRGPR